MSSFFPPPATSCLRDHNILLSTPFSLTVYARYEVLMAVKASIVVLWVVGGHRRFEHLKGLFRYVPPKIW